MDMIGTASPPPPPAAPSAASSRKRRAATAAGCEDAPSFSVRPGYLKRRKALSIVEEDVEILRVLLHLKPHRAAHGQVQRVWQQATDTVNAAMWRDMTVNRLTGRFYNLLKKYSDGRLRDPERRELMAEIVEDRQQREMELCSTGEVPKSGQWWYAARGVDLIEVPGAKVEASEVSSMIARGSSAMYPSVAETMGFSYPQEVYTKAPSLMSIDEEHDQGATKWREQDAPAFSERQSFVHAMLQEMGDRLLTMESMWLADAEKERRLRTQEVELKLAEKKAKKAEASEIAHLKQTVATLAKALEHSETMRKRLVTEMKELTAACAAAEKERLNAKSQVSMMMSALVNAQADVNMLDVRLRRVSEAQQAMSDDPKDRTYQLAMLSTRIQELSMLRVVVKRTEAKQREQQQAMSRYFDQASAERQKEQEQRDAENEDIACLVDEVQASIDEGRRNLDALAASVTCIAEEREASSRAYANISNKNPEKQKQTQHDDRLYEQIAALREELRREREDRQQQYKVMLMRTQKKAKGKR